MGRGPACRDLAALARRGAARGAAGPRGRHRPGVGTRCRPRSRPRDRVRAGAPTRPRDGRGRGPRRCAAGTDVRRRLRALGQQPPGARRPGRPDGHASWCCRVPPRTPWPGWATWWPAPAVGWSARSGWTRRLLDVANRQLVGELGTQMVDSAGGAVRVAADRRGLRAPRARCWRAALVTPERAGAEPDAAGEGHPGRARGGRAGHARRGRRAPVGRCCWRSAGRRTAARTSVRVPAPSWRACWSRRARTARAVVLAGPAGSGEADGLVGLLRSDAGRAACGLHRRRRRPGRRAHRHGARAGRRRRTTTAGPSGHFGVDAASRPRCC